MLSREPIANVIHEGIKSDIQHLIEQERHRAALLLIYAGIDTMAYITMPSTHTDVTRKDFIRWVDEYMEFNPPVTGHELYAARCGLLHTYSIESKLTRSGVRHIGYMAGGGPADVIVKPEIDPMFVMMSVEGLAKTFFDGIDRMLIRIFGDPLQRPTAEARLRSCIHQLDQRWRVGGTAI